MRQGFLALRYSSGFGRAATIEGFRSRGMRPLARVVYSVAGRGEQWLPLPRPGSVWAGAAGEGGRERFGCTQGDAIIETCNGFEYPRRKQARSMTLDDDIRGIFAPIQPKLILLFGSKARGTQDEWSDIDLIIVYDTEKRFLDRLEELYRLWDLPGAVDILAYTPAEFEEMKERSGLVADAVAHGRVIFEAV